MPLLTRPQGMPAPCSSAQPPLPITTHFWGSCLVSNITFSTSFFKDLFIFRERRGEGGREGEKHQYVFASRAPPTRNLARNPGMCPDWELNLWPSGSQASAQSTEPHQPGHSHLLIMHFHFSIPQLNNEKNFLRAKSEILASEYPIYMQIYSPLI